MAKSQTFTVRAGDNLNVGLGFLAGSCYIDNFTNQWWYHPQTGTWVRPYVTGQIINVGGTQVASFQPGAPPGIPTSPVNTEQVFQCTFFENVATPYPGADVLQSGTQIPYVAAVAGADAAIASGLLSASFTFAVTPRAGDVVVIAASAVSNSGGSPFPTEIVPPPGYTASQMLSSTFARGSSMYAVLGANPSATVGPVQVTATTGSSSTLTIVGALIRGVGISITGASISGTAATLTVPGIALPDLNSIAIMPITYGTQGANQPALTLPSDWTLAIARTRNVINSRSIAYLATKPMPNAGVTSDALLTWATNASPFSNSARMYGIEPYRP